MSLRLRPLAIFAASAIATVSAALHGAGCQTQSTTVAVRSLERSGRVSFVCLGPPIGALADGPVERPLSDCTNQQFEGINDYLDIVDDAGDVDAGTRPAPHLYALVTQTTRGEIAVIDTSSNQAQVLDENPVEPGANFLPVGAQPTAIVSTPGSVASFVAVAETGRAGIFALPSSMIRPASTANAVGGMGGAGGYSNFDPKTAQLSSWPVCSLPSAPGDMILVADPLVGGLERPTCDDAYATPAPTELISHQEARGRQKLVVAMPDMGGLAVIDAQTLLNQAAGAYEPCPVERWLPLEADLTGYAAPPPAPPPSDAACVQREIPQPALQAAYAPRPGGLTFADGTLYVADLAAPVIHVVDMATPCDPTERTPLLPTSAENPKRVVTTSRVSVAPAATPDFKRYLYATDIEDGSVMVFDVGPTSTTRRPLLRQHPEYNPFQPVDRMRFSAPPADVLVLQNDVPEINPITGLSVAGVRCNPDPNIPVCTATSPSCDIAANYATDRATYQSGAGPLKLRGTFAFVALTSGKVAVIDVDDFDKDCRGPNRQSVLYGCAENGKNSDPVPNTSHEQSCNVVSTNQSRSNFYEAFGADNGVHVPGLTDWPRLVNKDGAAIDFGAGPRMKGWLPPDAKVPDNPDLDCSAGLCCSGCEAAVGSAPTVDAASGHWLSINWEDPRAHIAAQDWTVTFEGPIPAFGQRLAELEIDPVKGGRLVDPDSRFCDNGVLGERAAREIYGSALTLETKNGDGTTTTVEPSALDWARYADYVQVMSTLPDELDPYWSGPAKAPDDNELACSYAECLVAYGTIDAPTPGRDLRIVEGYQDRLEVTPRPAACAVTGGEGEPVHVSCPDDPAAAGLDGLRKLKCCFPGALAFNVRVGSQWLAQGTLSGYLHHVVADPATGACRNSCDAIDQRRNGRVIEVPPYMTNGNTDAPIPAPLVFVNPMFRFGILRPGSSSAAPAAGEGCGTCGVGQTCFAAQCTPTATPKSCPVAHTCVAPQLCLRPDGSDCANAADCTCACPPGEHTTSYCGEIFRPDSATWRAADRDSYYRFTTANAFQPLLVSLAADSTTQVLPQSLAFLPPTGELVVTDGSLNGLIFVSLNSSTFSRSYF